MRYQSCNAIEFTFSQHRILSCFFFLFLVVVSNFLTIPVVREKNKVKIALAIPTGAPKMIVNETIDTPPLIALKTIKVLSMWSKQ